MRVAAPVREALAAGRAVVALESTVLTHGLPRPDNLSLGRRLEEVVARAGAVPATVGVVAGELIVGLDDAEMARLATRPAAKATLWNLAGAIARGDDAGTTVASTLHAAGRAGIRVFATGGIGGVHHDAGDVSADLVALAREDVLVVCAGPKSMLDARATLERLETEGVAVVGWKSDLLAGFLCSTTDLPVPLRADDVDGLVRIVRSKRAALLGGSIVVSRPVDDALEPATLSAWIDEAEAHAERAGVRGEAVTPFLLERLAEISGGATVEVNLRLLEANALLAAEIAVALERAMPPVDGRIAGRASAAGGGR